MLGVERGSLETALRRMLSEQVLERRQVKHARGEAFVLAPKWRRSLDKAVASAHPRGELRVGLRLLIVGVRDAGAVAEPIATAANDPRVVWAARLDGPARYVLALHVSSPEHVDQVDRLQAGFVSAGADCYQVEVSEVMDLGRLAKHSRNIAPLGRLRPAVARLHARCSGPVYALRSMSLCPRSHGSPGRICKPQRAHA